MESLFSIYNKIVVKSYCLISSCLQHKAKTFNTMFTQVEGPDYLTRQVKKVHIKQPYSLVNNFMAR